MRKLLVLMLVLGMASAANAAIVSFSADDGLPGDTIAITVSSDELVTSVMLALITDNGFGGTANPGAWDALFTIGADAGYNAADFGLGGTGELIIAGGAVDPGIYATGILYTYSYDIPLEAVVGSTITFTVEHAHGYVSSISYMVEDVATPMSITGMQFTSTVIPEPMTIALLGLGGLFLLRRRK